MPTRIALGFSLSDISYSSQQQQLKDDTLFYGGNLFLNITKTFSHYFQDTRESVTGFCGEVAYKCKLAILMFTPY